MIRWIFFSQSFALSNQPLPLSADEPNAEVGPEFLIRTPSSEISAIDDESTPVALEVLKDAMPTLTREWRPPTYNGQENALGYSPDVFAVPEGLKTQVNFWTNIYTKYTTDQGVIHDSENIDFIYKEIDFTEIKENASLSPTQKQRAREKLVKDAKKEVIDRLLQLQSVQSAEHLEGEDLRYWKMFSTVDELQKFKLAAQRGRLRFQLGQKDRIQTGIYLSGRYLEEMEKIFVDHGLPKELTRLAFVESSFNVFARSKVGASGLWQIMRYTARPYRMISQAIDKRNHPIEATRLAAKLLKQNYGMLQSWPLAITGYNHGPSGVRRMTQNYETRDIVELIQNVRSRRSFGFASRNFYASFLAILEVEKNANKNFKDVKWAIPLAQADLKLERSVSYKELLAWFDNNDEQTQLFNPHINWQVRRYNRSIPRGTLLHVPQEKIEYVLQEIKKKSHKVANNREVANGQIYEVMPGDTLSGIAQSLGVKVMDLLTQNELEHPNQLQVGQKLQVP